MRSSYDLRPDSGIDWLTRAACRGHPPQWWEAASRSNTQRLRENVVARAICQRCPVIEQCREQAERLGAFGMIVAGKTYVDEAEPRPYRRTVRISRQCDRESCTTVFAAVNNRQRFCSRRCQLLDWRRERRAGQVA